MSLADIKLNTAKRGFTIVELLIVVVVIAILAAITIVSYNGITNRANASASLSLANTWKKKLELYQAENGGYAWTVADLSGDSAKSWYITNDTLKTTAPNKDDGTKLVMVQACGSSTPTNLATTTGNKITYWQFDKSGGASTSEITVGTGASCATGAAFRP